MPIPRSYADTRAWARAMRGALTFEQCAAIFRNSPYTEGTMADVVEGYCTPPAIHFVGVTDDQYTAAFRQWGVPDYDWPRATWSLLGEIAPADVVVFGRGAFWTPKKKWKGRLLTAHQIEQAMT